MRLLLSCLGNDEVGVKLVVEVDVASRRRINTTVVVRPNKLCKGGIHKSSRKHSTLHTGSVIITPVHYEVRDALGQSRNTKYNFRK
jgi:hypothetical protein